MNDASAVRHTRHVIPSEARDLTNALSANARFFASLRMTRLLWQRRALAALLLFLLTKFAAADPGLVAKQTRDWRTRHEHEILAEFSDLLAIPNLASDTPNIERNANAIRTMFEKRGLTTQLLTHEGAPPIIVADLIVPGAKRTIAFYAHYDGQPVDPRALEKQSMETGHARYRREGHRLAKRESHRSGMAFVCALCRR